MNTKDLVSVIHDAVVTLAACAGGVWAYHRFLLERTGESALFVDLSSKSAVLPTPGMYLVFFEVTLRNVGKTQITARQDPTSEASAYRDSVEDITHSGSLEIKRLVLAGSHNGGAFDWFDSHAWASVPGFTQFDMLSDYENPDKGNGVEFWMEPGESYVLTKSIALPAGVYIAKFTFVGNRDGDFWTRLLQFSVPSS